jgi:hypothetical protein
LSTITATFKIFLSLVGTIAFHPPFIILFHLVRLSLERFGLASAQFAQWSQRIAQASGTAQLDAQEMAIIVVFVKCNFSRVNLLSDLKFPV